MSQQHKCYHVDNCHNPFVSRTLTARERRNNLHQPPKERKRRMTAYFITAADASHREEMLTKSLESPQWPPTPPQQSSRRHIFGKLPRLRRCCRWVHALLVAYPSLLGAPLWGDREDLSALAAHFHSAWCNGDIPYLLRTFIITTVTTGTNTVINHARLHYLGK